MVGIFEEPLTCSWAGNLMQWWGLCPFADLSLWYSTSLHLSLLVFDQDRVCCDQYVTSFRRSPQYRYPPIRYAAERCSNIKGQNEFSRASLNGRSGEHGDERVAHCSLHELRTGRQLGVNQDVPWSGGPLAGVECRDCHEAKAVNCSDQGGDYLTDCDQGQHTNWFVPITSHGEAEM